MQRAIFALGITILLGIVFVLALLGTLGNAVYADDLHDPFAANGNTLYVVPPTSTYAGRAWVFTTIQAAVDAATGGEMIKVAAGTYTGVSARPRIDTTVSGTVTQVLYISKTVTIRGGYTVGNWNSPDPEANPTIIDGQGQGRGIYVTGDVSPTIEGLWVTGGDAAGLDGFDLQGEYYGDAGGGIYVVTASVTLRANHVVSNTAGRGGGMFLMHANAAIVGNDLVSNTAEHKGGGIYLFDCAAAILELNAVRGNEARDNGLSGGGAFVYGGTPVLRDNAFVSNRANASGGGVCLSLSSAILIGNDIIGNTAHDGAGIYVYRSNATLAGNLVISNAASLYGGGINLVESSGTLDGNTIRANVAASAGGLMISESQLYVAGNLIADNRAGGDAGGVFMWYSDATLTNNIIAGNEAPKAGGLVIRGTSARLWHTTIAHNAGLGIRVEWLAEGRVVELVNTILSHHTVGIEAAPGATVTLRGTLWHNTVDWSGEGTVLTGTVNWWGDPGFLCVEADCPDRYRLSSDSLAIDAGLVVTDVTTDIDGDLRPMGAGPDLGADEAPGPGLRISQSVSPLVLNPGQTITYTIDVAAASTDVLTAVHLTHTLPVFQRAITARSAQGQCEVPSRWGGDVVCELGQVQPGAWVHITVTAQVTASVPSQLPRPMPSLVRIEAAETHNVAQLTTQLHNCHVRLNDDATNYPTLQAAIDASTYFTDLIRVAGYCTWAAPEQLSVPNMIHLTKTLTIQGGWNISFTQQDVVSYPTTLDARGLGRVFYIAAGAQPTVEWLHITGGNAWSTAGIVPYGERAGAGGGVYIVDASPTLRYNLVFGNEADSGGGLYLAGGQATIAHNEIVSNSGTSGGGIFLDPGDLVILDNLVANNTAQERGGGIYSLQSDALVYRNVFQANTAHTSGGGIYVEKGSTSIIENTLTSNVAYSDGGAVFIDWSDDASFIGNTVVSNTASRGGGVYLFQSYVRIAENLIRDNMATECGGGLGWESGKPRITGNTVIANVSEGSAGGICVVRGDGTLEGNVVSRNRANVTGGGMQIYKGYLTLINNIVADNLAPSGSGLQVEGGHLRIEHCTFVANRSTDDTGGDGIVVTGDSGQVGPGFSGVSLVNTILVGHATGITVAEESWAELGAVLWGVGDWANDLDWGGSGTIVTGAPAADVWGDPAFVCAGEMCDRPYRITAASAARDAGVDTDVRTDADGQPRPMGRGFDIGADEYPGPGLDISLHPSPRFLNPGQTLTWTLVITSTGIEDLRAITLLHTLDPWQEALWTDASQGRCAIDRAGDTDSVSCWMGAMSPGQTAIVTLAARVADGVVPRQAMTHTVVVSADGASDRVQETTFGQQCQVRVGEIQYTTVQDAVDAARPGDLVKVAGYCVGASARGGERQLAYLDKSLTLQGGYTFTNWVSFDPAVNPTTLDALRLGRVIYVTGQVSPTVRGLRITGGHTEGNGGGVCVAGGGALVTDNEITGNRADRGGGVYASGKAQISDNDVWGNEAREGGGICVYNGVRLDHNLIVDNNAIIGGGIAAEAEILIVGNVVRGNRAAHGGGVYLGYSHWRPLTLTNNLIVDNWADARGSGVCIEASVATLVHNTIANNRGGEGSGVHITNLVGASQHFGSVVSIRNTIIAGHRVGIVIHNNEKPDLDTMLWDNERDMIYESEPPADLELVGAGNVRDDPRFVDPSAGDYRLRTVSPARDLGVDTGLQWDLAGQPRLIGAAPDLGAYEYVGPAVNARLVAPPMAVNRGSTITYTIILTDVGTERAANVVLLHTLDVWQRATGIDSSMGQCSIRDEGWGGRAVCQLGTMSIDRTAVITLSVYVSPTVSLGQAMTHTIAVAVNGAVRRMSFPMYAQDCHVWTGNAEYTTVQSAVDAASPGDLLKIAGTCAGVAERAGVRQQVYLDKSLTLRGGYTPGNWETSEPALYPTTLDALGLGRVFYITGSITATIEGLRITRGSVLTSDPFLHPESMGGGIYVVSATAQISNSIIFSNAAQFGGGAAVWGGRARFVGNVFADNDARQEGGGLYALDSDLLLRANIISGNAASESGGGLYSRIGDITLDANRIISNVARYGGGGADLRASNISVTSNVISFNQANNGGGILMTGSGVTVSNNHILSNTAAGSGGGLSIWGDNVIFDDNLVAGNRATYGGGIVTFIQANLVGRGNVFVDNVAVDGGGIRAVGGELTLVNTVIAGNQAESAGSGVELVGSTAHFQHCTIADNAGPSATGLSVQERYEPGPSTVWLSNTILVGHAIGIDVQEKNTVYLASTLWNNDVDWQGQGTITTSDDFWGDPLFVDPARRNYHITPQSPAVDAGIDIDISVDIDGQKRPQGSGYDLGADEVVQIKRE